MSQQLEAPLIVVDMDDVLCQTNAAAAEWHNNMYGTRMTLDDFHSQTNPSESILDYHWWKNPGWGTLSETSIKVNMFDSSLDLQQASPIPGAIQAMQALKSMGYRLAIVTARSKEHIEQTTAWLDQWIDNIFESVHFTGDMVTLRDIFGNESRKRLTKGEVCEKLSACLLIDDAVDNVLSCATMGSDKSRTPALLFGDYQWGLRRSLMETPEDLMSFEQRKTHQIALGRPSDWWREDVVHLPEGVWRVKDWPGVLEWIQGAGKEIIGTRVA